MLSLAADHTYGYVTVILALNYANLYEGIPHQLEKDDIWNGYFIPKGAYIHAVEW